MAPNSARPAVPDWKPLRNPEFARIVEQKLRAPNSARAAVRKSGNNNIIKELMGSRGCPCLLWNPTVPFITLAPTQPDNFSAGINTFDPAHPRILIFTECTNLGPRHWWEFFNDRGYVTINLCVEKINRWYKQGARMAYLTSRRKPADVAAIARILTDAGLPGYGLYYRGKGEEYHHIAEQLIPDVLIEDDCRSIGGSRNWTITYVRPDIKRRIHSIVVREFGGIDDLPDTLYGLLSSS